MLLELIVCVGLIATVTRLYAKSTWKRFTENVDLTGTTVLVTGANSGIGQALAVEFARRNARVILACRSVIRGEGARQNILAEADRDDDGGIVFRQLDLSSLESVRKFAANILKTEPRLDILVNNAAVLEYPVTATDDGMELTYQTNHFGPFLLTTLLQDLLKKSGPGSRIVNVASFVNKMAKLNLDYISPEKAKHSIAHMQQDSFLKRKAESLLYANSKLMNILFTFELAKRLQGTGVLVNCACPGVVNTSLMDRSKRLVTIIIHFLLLVIAKSPKQGCQCILHCAISSRAGEVSGKYFRNCQISDDTHPMAKDSEARTKLWKISEELTGIDVSNASLSP
ncbi:unnamed protein product [Clavelina lepadiformis]|uniref:Uncharacterized protein n=1 Tax=Clavelina lepadiformis TaxID=159417 RepID=A0ABP0GFM5_CLALP